MTHKGWLTRENAKQLASEKLVQIYKYVSSRQADHQVLSEQHADAINTVNAATRGLMQSLFYSSVGVVLGDPPEEGETLYISSAPIGGNASTLDVYPWTHWVGRVATQLREAFEKGESLNHLTYGPPGKQTEREVGPLVLYRLENRQVTDCQFCAPSAHLGAGEGDDATSVNVLEMPSNLMNLRTQRLLMGLSRSRKRLMSVRTTWFVVRYRVRFL